MQNDSLCSQNEDREDSHGPTTDPSIFFSQGLKMEIPERNTLLDPVTDDLYDRTYSNFVISENLSFFHVSVRRGDFHGALQSALEAVMTGEIAENDILKSIYVILSEDIGPANPSLIIWAHRILERGSPDQQALALLVERMVESPKDRLFDWVLRSLTFSPVIPEVNQVRRHFRFLLFKLETELEDKNFETAVQIAGQIHCLDIGYPKSIEEKDWKKLRREFEASVVLEKCRRTSGGIWLPIMKIARRSNQKVCNLVFYLYRISYICRRQCMLQWVHAIWSICKPDQVVETWYESPDPHLVLLAEERLEFIEAHRRWENIIPIPNYILDNSGVEHFILQVSRLRNVRENGMEEQMEWLLKCLQVWKLAGILDKNFVLPERYLEE